MKLGKYQKAWIKSLREHPERQTDGILGCRTDDDYKACCLGEALMTLARVGKKKLPFFNDKICDSHIGNDILLEESYNKIGLKDDGGTFLNGFSLPSKVSSDMEKITTLAGANDNGYSWLEIADLLESQAENIFVKSK